MNYGIRIRLSEPYGAVVRVRDELKEQGFGVLTEIDVQATLRQKLQRSARLWLVTLDVAAAVDADVAAQSFRRSLARPIVATRGSASSGITCGWSSRRSLAGSIAPGNDWILSGQGSESSRRTLAGSIAAAAR